MSHVFQDTKAFVLLLFLPQNKRNNEFVEALCRQFLLEGKDST